MKKIILLIAAMAMIIGCQNDKPSNGVYSLNSNQETLLYTSTFQLEVKGGTAKATWSSRNEFVAKVDQNGLVAAQHVGQVDILCEVGSQTLECKIIVAPTSTLYAEPLLSFGQSAAEIKNTETREFIDQDTESLSYRDDDGNIVMYMFESDMMSTCAILLPISTEAKEVVEFLTERYIYLGQEVDYFLWASNTVGVALSVVKSGVLVMYVPLDETYSAISANKSSFESLVPAGVLYDDQRSQEISGKIKSLLAK